MGKKGILVAALLLAVVGGLAWLLWRPSEPIYRGKELSYWLAQQDRTVPTMNLASARLTPEAAEAVRSIGTNAIPILLRKLGGHSDMEGLVRRLPLPRNGPLTGLLQGCLAWTGYDPYRAVLGFRALGAVGKPAIPELLGRLKFQNQMSALFALCWIGQETVRPLTNAIARNHDQNTRGTTVANLALVARELGSNAPPLASFFTQNLKTDPSGVVRAYSVQALGEISPSSNDFIPIITDALKDREGLVRIMAVNALANFGPAARAAIPALENALRDENPQVRTDAATALMRINPEAAARVGVK